MTIKLEAGQTYRMRNGWKVTLEPCSDDIFPFQGTPYGLLMRLTWRLDGRYNNRSTEYDIIALWEEPAAPPTSPWHPMTELPEVGRKFVVLYSDGSGASMFCRHDGMFTDDDGNELDELPFTFSLWSYLPDDYKFWCENSADDPECWNEEGTTYIVTALETKP